MMPATAKVIVRGGSLAARVALLSVLVAAGCGVPATQGQDAGPSGSGGSASGGTSGSGGAGMGGIGVGGAGSGGAGVGGMVGVGGTIGVGGVVGVGGAGVGGMVGVGGTGAGGMGVGGTGVGGTGVGGTGGTSLRDRFPPARPATITVTGKITKNDVQCVIVGTAGGCLAQNMPPCTSAGGQATITLHLTIDAQDNITVEAPYQDMCAPDYFCAVSGHGCPIPTSYPVPLTNQLYSYDPRSTDRCRR